MRCPRLLLLALALTLIVAAPAAAADGLIATLPEVSPLKSLGDTVAWVTGGKLVVTGEDALCPCRLEERTMAGWRVP